jgi:hypothetical protein
MRYASLPALVALAAASISMPAYAAERLTRLSCIEHLTVDPAGPQLDPTRLKIGSVIVIDGAGHRVYQDMALEDICDLAVRRNEELAAKGRGIAAAKEQARIAIQAKDASVNELERIRKDPAIHYAGLTMTLSVTLSFFFLVFLYFLVLHRPFKGAIKSLKMWGVRKRRSPHSHRAF